ncbi:MAG: PKD domain-containing protein, partial [Saprospiraceae bacterium]
MNNLYSKINSRISRIAVTIVFLITSLAQTYATHIVGGNITYKCLGGEKYEISVTMRRDCFNGDPEAFFDDPASIGIFDQKGFIVRAVGTNGQLILPLKFNDTLDEIREDICAVTGTTSVCIHETTYKGIITLPFRPGGYIIEYQRCCRNGIIQNIQEPLLAGASWIVQINEEAMKVCNNTPRFKQWSPIFVCSGLPFRFDHGAIDDDGDSLVYKLWTPFLGATRGFPKPQPPNAPDFKKVNWKSPYSETDMMGGDPFKIDSKTGELFAVPTSLGQYLLGVLVEEYRHGVLLSTVYRDFEVKILDCANLVDAKIVAPKLQCDNLTINFKQESLNPKYVRWFFDYGRNPNATSTEISPTYKYTDTGTYKVALVITRDSSCFDTAFQTIRLKLSKTTVPLFTTKSGDCINGLLKLSMIDLSTGVEPGSRYTWTLLYNSQTITSNEKNPTFTVPNGVFANIKLEISQEGEGCSVNISKTFITAFIQPEFHKDQAVACVGDTIAIKFILQDTIKGKYNYIWDASPLIVGGKNTAEPIVFSSAAQSGYIYVTVDNKQGCTSRDSILIIFKVKPKLAYTFVNACGSLSIKVKNTSDTLTDYLWSFGDGSSSTEREPTHTYVKSGKYTVILSTTVGCAPSLSKTFNIGDIVCFDLTDSIVGCIGTTLMINPKANPAYAYQWRPTNKLNDLSIPNPSFKVDSARTFIADISDVNTGIGLGKIT